MAISTHRCAPYHNGGYSQSLTLLAVGRSSAAAARWPLDLVPPQVHEAVALVTAQRVCGSSAAARKPPLGLLRRAVRLALHARPTWPLLW
jgi:hypothetical protein